MKVSAFGCIALAVCGAAHAQPAAGPAPAGNALKVAAREIAKTGHACPRVVRAIRDASGAIRATCSNGEVYLINSAGDPGQAVLVTSLRCTAARRSAAGC